jgi:hypothetical protein
MPNGSLAGFPEPNVAAGYLGEYHDSRTRSLQAQLARARNFGRNNSILCFIPSELWPDVTPAGAWGGNLHADLTRRGRVLAMEAIEKQWKAQDDADIEGAQTERVEIAYSQVRLPSDYNADDRAMAAAALEVTMDRWSDCITDHVADTAACRETQHIAPWRCSKLTLACPAAGLRK